MSFIYPPSGSRTLNATTSPDSLPLALVSSSSGLGIATDKSSAKSPFLLQVHSPNRPAMTDAESLTQINQETPVDDSVKKKKTPGAFQLSNKSIPDDAGHIKEALWFHIQLFGRLFQRGALIGPTPPELINEFNKHFNCLEDVAATHDNTSTSSSALGPEHHLINIAKVQLATLPSNSTLRVKQQFRRMESFMFGYMQATLACFGMRQWNPDFTQPSDSLFNVACRFIVVGTFRQVLMTRSYAAYKIPMKYANSYNLLSKIYDHIVHYHFAARFRKELDNPGSVATAAELQAWLVRRVRLSKARISWLAANKYPPRYIALCNAAATSDDEPDPNDTSKKTYQILRRPERSKEAEHWIRCLETKRIQDNKYKHRRGSRQYSRHTPHVTINSSIETLPQNMPLDYYDPDFFNRLQYHTQQLCANAGIIALPEDKKSWFTLIG